MRSKQSEVERLVKQRDAAKRKAEKIDASIAKLMEPKTEECEDCNGEGRTCDCCNEIESRCRCCSGCDMIDDCRKCGGTGEEDDPA